MGTSRFAAVIVLALTLTGTRAVAETPLEAGRTVTTLAGSKFDFEGTVKNGRATVLVFWSAGCPCVRRYEQRVEQLVSKYGAQGVTVLGVASNAGEDPATVQRAVKERGLKLEVLHDPGGKLADAVGARSTPTVAVLDREGKVAYLGWVDNEREPGVKGREPYLERALDAMLKGEGGFSKRSPVYGCRITKRLFGEVGHCKIPPASPEE